jgi:3D (Asp-Asp-Asp) domain-containing protein
MNINLILSLTFLFLPYELKRGQLEVQKQIKGIVPIIVTATTYKANSAETDEDPHITASGFVIDMDNPYKHRLIAISRDLKRKWKFGTKVLIQGTGEHDGVYYVRDLMNKRYKKRVDILIGHKDKQSTFKKVKIYKLP